MDTPQLVLLALALGVLIGAGVALLVHVALRVRAHAAAAESQLVPEGVRAMLQAMDDVAIVVDGALTVVAASEAAELFQLREGATVENEALRELIRQARVDPNPGTRTMELRRGVALSEPRVVITRARPITAKHTLVVVRDITEHERVEQMRRDFVANTSHELKTPVGAVMLLAEAIDSAADDPVHVRKFAGRLTAEAARLSQLTSRIMSLSRLQSEEDLNRVRDVPIDEVISTVIAAHQVAAASARVELARGGDRGAIVRGDVQVLTEAIGNVVANAIAYSHAGGSVGIGVKAADGIVEVAVADHGIGIAEGDQQRIFERFYRADAARSRSTGGTGLGLSIVKHAIQRHGGEITVWSRPGRGSTFTIRLPGTPGDGAAQAKKKKKKKRKTATSAPAVGRTKKEKA